MLLQQKTKDELVSEYYRASLFGQGKNGKRRSPAEILTDLKDVCRGDFPQCQAEWDDKVACTRQQGQEAASLAQQGIPADSVELENLLLRAAKLFGNDGRQYVHKPFLDTEANTAQPAQAAAPQKTPQTIREEDFFTPKYFSQSEKAGETFPDTWNCCPPNQITSDFGQLMYQYCTIALWDDGSSQKDAMNQRLQKLRSYHPERVDQALLAAKAWVSRAKEELKKALARQSDSPEQEAKLRALGGPLKHMVDKQRNKVREYKQKVQAAKNHQVEIKGPAAKNASPAPQAVAAPAMPKIGRTLAGYAGHANEILRLRPASEWNLYIDESGGDLSFDTNGEGVIAGALNCSDNPLPAQPRLHASTDSTETLLQAGDKVIETLIHHDQCGVLAIPARAYDSAQGWGSLIASYIDIVLRLLPLPENGAKVKLNIFVEGRAPYTQDIAFSFLRDACRYNLMHVFPERASSIEFSIQPMDKNNPYNAYPDLIAHTCYARKSGMAKERFQASGWQGTCFLNYPASELRNVLEYFFNGRNLPAEEWDNLLAAGAMTETGLLAALLQTIGTEARQNRELWQTYLNRTASHLSSKAIRLPQLSAQINWLKRYQPLDAVLPPRVKLLWLTAKLAEANHLGEIERQSPVAQEFLRLIEDLYDEDAPLTCWAVLHLAVQKTNAYQFAEAKKLITAYCAIGSLMPQEPPFPRIQEVETRQLAEGKTRRTPTPAAIPGLRYYGQLLSSCGQHEAFLGNLEKAIAYFKEAIGCFERLSEDMESEIDQTMAYYATAHMDLAPHAQATLDIVERYLGASLTEAARNLAASDHAKDKYHHHILLRYLVQSRNEDAVKAYVQAKADWKTDQGHPWAMIEFYRALLLDDDAVRWQHMTRAYDIARQAPGATMWLMACVMQGGALFYRNIGSPKALLAVVDDVAAQIPDLGEKRLDALRRQITQPVPPLELAAIVLPFNFR